MQEVRRTLWEFLTVGALVMGAGLLANALNSDGLSLDRDYFGKIQLQTDATPPNSSGSDQPGPADGDLIAKVSARLREAGLQPIDRAGVLDLFNSDEYEIELAVFVDARNDDHYQSGHVPGAFQFDHFHMDRYLETVMPICETAEQIVVYCYGMDCTDSEITARHLIDFGVDPGRVHVYVGGIQDWCQSGQQVEVGQRGSGTLEECAQ